MLRLQQVDCFLRNFVDVQLQFFLFIGLFVLWRRIEKLSFDQLNLIQITILITSCHSEETFETKIRKVHICHTSLRRPLFPLLNIYVEHVLLDIEFQVDYATFYVKFTSTGCTFPQYFCKLLYEA